MGWSPDQYLRFGDHRTRAARDLLARVPIEDPRSVVDLGCGPGNSTQLLVDRWPQAQVTGVDRSEAMLERARASVPDARFESGDVASFRPDADVIYANALLHWVDGHLGLLEGWLDGAPKGRALAVQVPRNFGEPSHLALRETALEARWSKVLGPLLRPVPVHEPDAYWLALAPRVQHLDVWEAVYWQELAGADAVLEWMRGTALVPFHAALGGPEQAAFDDALGARLRAAYPVRGANARSAEPVLFPFRRLFLVAVV